MKYDYHYSYNLEKDRVAVKEEIETLKTEIDEWAENLIAKLLQKLMILHQIILQWIHC